MKKVFIAFGSLFILSLTFPTASFATCRSVPSFPCNPGEHACGESPFLFCCTESEYECLLCNTACSQIDPSLNGACYSNINQCQNAGGESIGPTANCASPNFCCCISSLPPPPASCISPNGCFDCQWRVIAGIGACRAVNITCEAGYTHDADRCGQLTPQGSSVCEQAVNQNIACVLGSGDECIGFLSNQPGTCYTTSLCPSDTFQDGEHPNVCSIGGRCCIDNDLVGCTSPNGCFDCQWRVIAGIGACRAVNQFCTNGYFADADRCGQLTPQGSSVCEQAVNQNIACVGPSGTDACIGIATGRSGQCYTQALCPGNTTEDGEYPAVCSVGGRCCVSQLLQAEQEVFCDSSGNPTTDPATGKLYTAIGCVPVSNVTDFAGFMIRWGMGIGGGVSFLLIVAGGFIILASSGNLERIKAGKELITAAISGLALVIFSVFILEMAGYQILRLPGF